MQTSLLLILCCSSCLLTACSTESSHRTPQKVKVNDTFLVKANSGLLDSVQIMIHSTPRDTELGYLDAFNNYYSLPRGSQSVPLPIVVRDAYRDNQTYFILTHPIDSIRFAIDQRSGFWIILAPTKQLEDELNFDVRYRQWAKESGKGIDMAAFLAKHYVQLPQQRDKAIEKAINTKLTYLKNYQQTHHLSENFLTLWRTAIQYEKLYYLLYLGEQFQEWPADYLRRLGAYQSSFRSDASLYLPQYRQGAWNLLRIIHHLAYPSSALKMNQLIQITNQYFRGETREFLVASLLMNAKDNDSRLLFTKVEFQSLLKEYMATAQNPEFKAYVQTATTDIVPLKGDDALLSLEEKVVPLRQALLQSKINYIDFWASWCGPCLAEMPASKKLRSAYAGKGVQFLYLSIDQNPAAWQRAMKQLGLPVKESFLLSEGNQSALARRLQIKSIPRYVLLDSAGRILRRDAARPSDAQIQRELDALLDD